MTYQDFAYELNRLDAIKIPKTEQDSAERKALEQELWRKYSWMLPPQWQATVSWVIDKHKGKALPAMPEFSAAIGMMRDKGIIKTEACRSCGGTKMQYVKVRHTNTGREFEACKPCSVCMVGAQWELKPDLELIGEGGGNSSALRMAHAMTPQGAYWALHKSNDALWDDDVKMILLDKAIKYEAEIEEKKSKQPPAIKAAAQLIGSEIDRIQPLKPQREQAAPLPVVEHVSPPQGTASVPLRVAEALKTVTVNGEEYEIEE